MEKLVSIITPCYNSEKYIGEAIESVLRQTYENWEMIIIDDGSYDGTPEIINKYILLDSRIKCYRNEKNIGVAASRNRAISLSQGEYISFLDSDDIWLENKLEKQIDYIKRGDVSFVYSSCYVSDDSGVIVGKRLVKGHVGYYDMLHGNAIPCLTVMLEREAIEKLLHKEMQFPIMGHEDYALWLEILKKGMYAYGIEECLAIYRNRVESLSSNYVRTAKWNWLVLKKNEPFKKCIYYMACYIVNAIKKRKGA